MLDARLDEEGNIKIEVKWHGFNETTWESISSILNGAHWLLKKFIEAENNNQIDEQLKTLMKRKIKEREQELETAFGAKYNEAEKIKQDIIEAKKVDTYVNDEEVRNEVKIEVLKPSFIKGWTPKETQCLKRLLET